MKNKTFLTALSFGMVLIFAYPIFPAQPDLKVTKIELVSGCKVRFTFKNIGGPITSPYTFSTQFSKNGSAWGGYSNTLIDPNGNLAQAGGTALYTRYEGVGGGTHTIGATIDISDQITESDENNNIKEVILNCTSEPEITAPDFQVANILLNPNCAFAIVLKNGGMEPIPLHEYKRGNGMLIHVTKKWEIL